MPDKAELLVLSSHTNPGMTAPINHAVYCSRHRYQYTFDVTPYLLKSKYDQKITSILANIERAKWLLWIDDDAYFTDLSISLAQFLPTDDNVQFVFCNSPVNPSGEWTVLNSGVFFIRSGERAEELLREALDTNLSVVRNWWSPQYGLLTNGDQDQLVYTFTRQNLIGTEVQIRPFLDFNARTYNYKSAANDAFICHLCGYADKSIGIKQMRRFGLDDHLLPSDAAADYPLSMFLSERLSPPKSLSHSVKERMKRAAAKLMSIW